MEIPLALLQVPTNSPNIGQCIYCGSIEQPLDTEHAVPYGLNGQWTLLNASCRRCADVTHRFERDTLKCLLPAVRTVLAMRTRRRRERPATLPLVIQSRGVTRTIQVLPRDYPLYLPTPVFHDPGAISGNTPVPGISGEMRLLHIAGPTFEEFSRRQHDAHFVGTRLNFAPEYFARTLAKIAFCAGVYVLGLAPFTYTPIRSVILGEDPCVGHWVGSWSGELITEEKGIHAMQVRASGSDIHVILRLFAQFGAPEYHVVLGPADPAFVESEAWPWK